MHLPPPLTLRAAAVLVLPILAQNWSACKAGAPQLIMSYGFNPQTSWRECTTDGIDDSTEWFVCLSSQGDAFSVCPLDSSPPNTTATHNSAESDSSLMSFHESASYTFWGSPIRFQPCFPCPSSEFRYGTTCHSSVENVTQIFQLDQKSASNLLEVCTTLCENGRAGEYCSNEEGEGCLAHTHFCDFNNNQNEVKNEGDSSDLQSNLNLISNSKISGLNLNTPQMKRSGTCQPCPSNIDQCYHPSFLSTESSRESCVSSCEPQCDDFGYSKLLFLENGYRDSDDNNDNTENADRQIPIEIPSDYVHLGIQNPHLNTTAPLIDCTYIFRNPNVDTCEGAQGKVCFVELPKSDIKYWKLGKKAQKGGCIGIVFGIRNVRTTTGDNVACGHNSYDVLNIPILCVGKEDGQRIKAAIISSGSSGAIASLEVSIAGQACHRISPRGTTCSDSIPCTSTNMFCPFDKTVSKLQNINGWCNACPVDEFGNPTPLACYFELDDGVPRDVKFIEDCVTNCDAQIKFSSCKFCPDKLDALHFGIEDPSDKCLFCPNYDLKYPERIVPLFGDNIQCWQMQAFYEYVDVSKNSQNCQLAQSMNYICGCGGVGYAGANTDVKKEVLVWMPRAMAMLSIFGSFFILYDTIRTPVKRKKLLNQMLATLSFFDIVGSIAYAFTTLPIPEENYLYGSKGNDKTCMAQGFFIQIGTIACFMNVSISVYYLLTIDYGWKNERLMSKRPWFVMPPIVVGLVFACVGIPFYDNLYLWCNNAARYWPEIPVILAILAATTIMINICLNVRKTTQASAQYTYSRNSVQISKMVFEQACWFTGAFYVTWVPYLAMQYMWSSGKAFTNYGFILYAASSVPLQGFWNFIVYARPRYLNQSHRPSRILSRAAKPVSSLRSSMRRLSIGSQGTIEEIARRAAWLPRKETTGRVDINGNQDANQSQEGPDAVVRGSADADASIPPSHKVTFSHFSSKRHRDQSKHETNDSPE